MKVKVESEKVGLKLNIQKTKIMASGPITSWEIDRETVETVSDFIFGYSKITRDGDFSHEIKRRLFLGRKVMTNLDSIFKSRDITLSNWTELKMISTNLSIQYGSHLNNLSPDSRWQFLAEINLDTKQAIKSSSWEILPVGTDYQKQVCRSERSTQIGRPQLLLATLQLSYPCQPHRRGRL